MPEWKEGRLIHPDLKEQVDEIIRMGLSLSFRLVATAPIGDDREVAKEFGRRWDRCVADYRETLRRHAAAQQPIPHDPDGRRRPCGEGEQVMGVHDPAFPVYDDEAKKLAAGLTKLELVTALLAAGEAGHPESCGAGHMENPRDYARKLRDFARILLEVCSEDATDGT